MVLVDSHSRCPVQFSCLRFTSDWWRSIRRRGPPLPNSGDAKDRASCCSHHVYPRLEKGQPLQIQRRRGLLRRNPWPEVGRRFAPLMSRADCALPALQYESQLSHSKERQLSQNWVYTVRRGCIRYLEEVIQLIYIYIEDSEWSANLCNWFICDESGTNDFVAKRHFCLWQTRWAFSILCAFACIHFLWRPSL